GVTLYTNSLATVGAALAAGSGSWSVVSDRNLKANFSVVDGQQVLDALARTPIQTWNYTSQDASIRHMGATAQDFQATFHVADNDETLRVFKTLRVWPVFSDVAVEQVGFAVDAFELPGGVADLVALADEVVDVALDGGAAADGHIVGQDVGRDGAQAAVEAPD